MFNGTIENKNKDVGSSGANKNPIVPPLQIKKEIFNSKSNKERETIVPTPDQGFNSVDVHEGFEDQDLEVLEGLVYPNK